MYIVFYNPSLTAKVFTDEDLQKEIMDSYYIVNSDKDNKSYDYYCAYLNALLIEYQKRNKTSHEIISMFKKHDTEKHWTDCIPEFADDGFIFNEKRRLIAHNQYYKKYWG